MRETGCNYSTKGGMGGEAQTEKEEIIADLSQNTRERLAQSRLISCPNAAAVIAPRPVLLQVDFKEG